MRHAVCLLLLVSLLTAGEREQVEARVHAVAKELAALGYEVDVEKLDIKVRPIGAKLDRDPAPLTEKEKRIREAEGIVSTFGLRTTERVPRAPMAYFTPWRPAIVFTRALACSWLGADGLTAHEPVHAFQAQREGAFDRAIWRSCTTERRNVLRCLHEGEAELVAHTLLFARLRRSFADVPEDMLRLWASSWTTAEPLSPAAGS